MTRHAGRRACTYTVAPTTQSVLRGGGSHSAAVTTTSGCDWTGVSNSTNWITVTSGSSGTGDGTVTYNVAARTSASSRTGTLTIAGQTVTVTQSGHVQLHRSPRRRKAWWTSGGSYSTAVSDDERLRLDRREQ